MNKKQIAEAKKKDRCTLWFDNIWKVYIGQFCHRHDNLYTKPQWYEKLGSDVMLMLGVAWEGITHVISGVLTVLVAIPMYLAVSTVGWYFWFKSDKE